MHVSRTTTAIGTAVLAVAALGGCAGDDLPTGVAGDAAALDGPGAVTVTSGDETVAAEPVCVGDRPDDVSECAAPASDLAQLPLHPTRKATLVVPQDVAQSGYRLRFDAGGSSAGGEVVEDVSNPFQVPPEVVAAPGPTLVTVEGLSPARSVRAVWQFRLLDPAGAGA